MLPTCLYIYSFLSLLLLFFSVSIFTPGSRGGGPPGQKPPESKEPCFFENGILWTTNSGGLVYGQSSRINQYLKFLSLRKKIQCIKKKQEHFFGALVIGRCLNKNVLVFFASNFCLPGLKWKRRRNPGGAENLKISLKHYRVSPSHRSKKNK